MKNRHLFHGLSENGRSKSTSTARSIAGSSVALMATCIDVAMRSDPADDKTSPEVRDAAAVPKLELSMPLNAEDQIFQELYNEATTFWAAGLRQAQVGQMSGPRPPVAAQQQHSGDQQSRT